MTKVNYLNFRTLLALALALLVFTTGGCVATQRAKVVSPVSGDVEGPRSFDELSRQVREQSEELRLLAIRTRGLYRYYLNRYRVRIRVEEGGEVSEVEVLERGFVLPEFEERFVEIVGNFQFTEYEGEPVEFVYTFEFYPEAPKGALEHAAAREEAARAATMEESMNAPKPADEESSEDMMEPTDEPAAAGMEEMPSEETVAEPTEEPSDAEAEEMSEPEAAPMEEVEEPEGEAPAEMTEDPADMPEAAAPEPEVSEIDETDLEENSSMPKEQ